MGELQHVLRATSGHEGVVNLLLYHHATQRLRAVGDLLGKVQDVRRHAKGLGTGPGTAAAKAGNDLVKNQQNVVRCANLAQALQVAHRRNDHAGGTRKRLDDHRSNVAGIVQVDDVEQVVGQRRALPARAIGLGRGHAFEERAHRGLGVRQVVGFHALAKQLAVAHNAAHRNAAKVHAVVTLDATNEAGFLAHALGAPVGAGHFQRRVGRLGARAREENMAQPRRHAFHHLVGQLERQRVAKLECGRVVQRAHLLRHGSGDFFAPVAQARAPQT